MLWPLLSKRGLVTNKIKSVQGYTRRLFLVMITFSDDYTEDSMGWLGGVGRSKRLAEMPVLQLQRRYVRITSESRHDK